MAALPTPLPNPREGPVTAPLGLHTVPLAQDLRTVLGQVPETSLQEEAVQGAAAAALTQTPMVVAVVEEARLGAQWVAQPLLHACPHPLLVRTLAMIAAEEAATVVVAGRRAGSGLDSAHESMRTAVDLTARGGGLVLDPVLAGGPDHHRRPPWVP